MSDNAKTIDTLVDDIYTLMNTGKKNPNQEWLMSFGMAVMDGVKRQMWMSSAPKRGALRMSNVGKPCVRALWYDVNGTHDPEPLTPQTRLKFMMGDIVEALLLYLAREAGHEVKDQQREIEIDGVKGHLDAVIDGELVDVKSTSSYGMKKFKDGTLAEDDPFGYVGQISGYGNALGKSQGTFLAFDKSNGELATYTHEGLEDTSARIKMVKDALAQPEPPERGFEAVKDRASNRQKLGINCSYCPHKYECWADKNLELKFRSGKPVFLLEEEETAVESKDRETYGF